MDIKCERCGTEYEFEDNRVTEEGVTVKCSSCGHLFKIRKKSFVLTEPVVIKQEETTGETDAKGRNWIVRKPDGSVLSFKELTTLQKWIVERKVAREDEISKSGESWKRLGSIAELASFFRVVDQASSNLPSSGSIPTPGPMPAVNGPEFPTDQYFRAPSSPSIPAASYPPTPNAGPVSYGAPPPNYAPQQGLGSQPAFLASTTQPAPNRAEPDSWGDAGGNMSAPAYEPSTEDDVVEKWKRRGRRKWYLIVPLLLLVIGVGVFYLVNPEGFMKVFGSLLGKSDQLPALAVKQFQTGYEHFLKDSSSELSAAAKDLDSAVKEAKGKYPAALALLGEVYLAQAVQSDEQIHQEQSKLPGLEEQLKALMPAEGKDIQAEAKEKIAALTSQKTLIEQDIQKLQAEARRELDEAERQIQAARDLDTNAFEPKRALAKLLWLKKAGRSQIEVPLREAQTLHKEDPQLQLVEGEIYTSDPDPVATDSAIGKLSAAIDLQKQAGKPELVRARYLLAKVLSAKRPEDAKEQLQLVLQHSPDHQGAKALLAALTAPPPEPPKPPEKKEEPKPAEPEKPSSYEGWMALGTRLQQKGKSQQALDAFDAALSLKPDDVEAMTGKGLSFLDLGSYAAAANTFKKVLKRNGSYADAIMGLAESYKYQGNKEEAVKYYKRYLEVLPDGPEAEVAKRNVGELQ